MLFCHLQCGLDTPGDYETPMHLYLHILKETMKMQVLLEWPISLEDTILLAERTDQAIISVRRPGYSRFDTPQAEENWYARITILKECVAKLNPNMRTVVEMFYKSRFSLVEISSKLSLNVMAIGQRLSRARKLIRVCVESKTH